MCEPEVTHKKREVSKLRRQVCRHITKLRLWQRRPYTVAEVTSRPGWNGAPPGEGAELTAVAVAKAGYPDRWYPERGKKVAIGKATKAITLALWEGELYDDQIEVIGSEHAIEQLTGVPLGISVRDIKIGPGPCAGKLKLDAEPATAAEEAAFAALSAEMPTETPVTFDVQGRWAIPLTGPDAVIQRK